MDYELIDALLKVLRCFGECEGTWYEFEWPAYGVTPEQKELIHKTYERKFPDAPMAQLPG